MPHDPWEPLKRLLRKRAQEMAERRRLQSLAEAEGGSNDTPEDGTIVSGVEAAERLTGCSLEPEVMSKQA